MNWGVVSCLSCAAKRGFLGLSRNPSELENQRSNTLQDIRGLFDRAQPYPQSAVQQIRIAASGPPTFRILSPDTRIIELDIAEIALNYPGFPATGRGLYDPITGKIILCQGKWCKETLIHETLHSVSFGAARLDLGRRYVNLFEGLTEFFTGFIMFCRYPACYEAWKEERYQECSVTYAPSVRLWAAFCRFARIQELLRIYFWDGTTDWEKRCDELIASIHQAGYPAFGDFRRRPIPTIEMKILDECLKSFGRPQFMHIYESALTELLDFNQILH